MPTPPKTQPNPETSLEDRLSNIEVLLRQAELVAEEARQREYALRTRRLISEAKNDLMDIGARHGYDIETCGSTPSGQFLDYAIIMAPNLKRPDIYTYEVPDLKNRIYITRDLLDKTLTSPIRIQNLPQELAYEGYIKRSRELTQEAILDTLDIVANYRKDILPTELADFKTSLQNIEHETSAVYNDLCTWKTSLARHPARATQGYAPTTESKHTSWLQTTQQKVQKNTTDHPSQGKLSISETMDTVYHRSRPALQSNETPWPPPPTSSATVPTQDLQTPQIEPGGDVTILTSSKLPPPHQVRDTKEEGSANQKHHGHLNDRSSTITSLPNREETNQHPDANTTSNKTKDPHSPPDKVSNNLDTTLMRENIHPVTYPANTTLVCLTLWPDTTPPIHAPTSMGRTTYLPQEQYRLIDA